MALAFAADDPKDDTEPPVRLKKKNSKAEPPPQPKADPADSPKKEPAKEDARKKDEKPEPDEPAPDVDEQEVLDRVSKNMRVSEKRLAEKDPGDGTQQVQRDILKDLDSLIQQQKQQQQMGGGGGGGGGESSSSARSKGQQGSRGSRSQSAGSRSKSSGSQSANSSGQSLQKGGSGNQAGHGNATGDPKDPNKLADLFKDIWGHLPEKMRVEMDAYSREQFMMKYSDLLKQYYATIAEKGRRKGNEP